MFAKSSAVRHHSLFVSLYMSEVLNSHVSVCVSVSLSLFLGPDGPDKNEIRPVGLRLKIRPVRLGLHALFSEKPKSDFRARA